MDNYAEILQKRGTPGVLIFDFEGRLLYCNEEALRIIPELQSSDPGYAEGIASEISLLCDQIKNSQTIPHTPSLPGIANSMVLHRSQDIILTMRGFLIGSNNNGSMPEHIMVLVEGITESRKIDFGMAQKKYMLSPREIEVVQLLCQGLLNKEIAGKLFISEYTVKDHIKKIMEKMKAATRSGIIALLK